MADDVDDLWRELDVLQDRLTRSEEHVDSTRERRNEIMRRLLDEHKVARASVARRVGMTSMAVEWAAHGRPDREPKAADKSG